jgi:hypothetical protein
MRKVYALVGLLSLVFLTRPLFSQAPPAGGQVNPQIGTSATTVLAPGLDPVPDYRQFNLAPPAPKVPEGFTPLFNGVDLTGWHTSTEARHGTTPDFHVLHGIILGTQRPLGRGGLLITDRKFRNFEFYMEAKPDFGNDSGIFFRSTEGGAAYQITLDYLPGGTMGRFIKEGGIQPKITSVAPQPAAAAGTPDPGMSAWKRDDWNTVRVRVEGDAPHVTVWINDQLVTDARDAQNSAVGGMVSGPIVLQIHGGPARWQPSGFWRWRNVAIKELK